MMQESNITQSFNEYYLFGDRPVKFVTIGDEHARQILKFDWGTGFFVPGPDYLQKILFGKDEVESLSEGEFILATETLRRTRFRGDNPVFALYQLVESILNQARSERRPLSEEENALIFLTYQKSYQLFEKVSVLTENYWKKQ